MNIKYQIIYEFNGFTFGVRLKMPPLPNDLLMPVGSIIHLDVYDLLKDFKSDYGVDINPKEIECYQGGSDLVLVVQEYSFCGTLRADQQKDFCVDAETDFNCHLVPANDDSQILFHAMLPCIREVENAQSIKASDARIAELLQELEELKLSRKAMTVVLTVRNTDLSD